MNDMTDAQISKALALAIGYRPEDVRVPLDSVAEVRRSCSFGVLWMTFDYKSPSVIWAVAEHYAMFPQQTDEGWHVTLSDWLNNRFSDTAAKAVALAVIRAHGG